VEFCYHDFDVLLAGNLREEIPWFAGLARNAARVSSSRILWIGHADFVFVSAGSWVRRAKVDSGLRKFAPACKKTAVFFVAERVTGQSIFLVFAIAPIIAGRAVHRLQSALSLAQLACAAFFPGFRG